MSAQSILPNEKHNTHTHTHTHTHKRTHIYRQRERETPMEAHAGAVHKRNTAHKPLHRLEFSHRQTDRQTNAYTHTHISGTVNGSQNHTFPKQSENSPNFKGVVLSVWAPRPWNVFISVLPDSQKKPWESRIKFLRLNLSDWWIPCRNCRFRGGFSRR